MGASTSSTRDGPARAETNLHRSFAPRLCYSRRPAVALQTTAWESACSSCIVRFDRSSVPNVSGRLQATGGARPKVESSRRTRRRHIRTRSCTARWSCFRTSILWLDPAVGRLGVPDTAKFFDSHLHFTWKSGEAMRKCADGKYARRGWGPQVSRGSLHLFPKLDFCEI